MKRKVQNYRGKCLYVSESDGERGRGQQQENRHPSNDLLTISAETTDRQQINAIYGKGTSDKEELLNGDASFLINLSRRDSRLRIM